MATLLRLVHFVAASVLEIPSIAHVLPLGNLQKSSRIFWGILSKNTSHDVTAYLLQSCCPALTFVLLPGLMNTNT